MEKEKLKLERIQIDETLKKQTKKAKKKLGKTIKEYKKFAIKGNVIDLAIGVVIGSAFTNIVNSIVNGLITPLISLLTNKVDLSTLFFAISETKFEHVEAAKSAGVITFQYGLVLNAAINFIIISVTLFLMIKYLNKIGKEKEVKVEGREEKECPYCLSKIPRKATKCKYCTSELEKIRKVKCPKTRKEELAK